MIAIPLLLAVSQVASTVQATPASDQTASGAFGRSAASSLLSPPDDWTELPELQVPWRGPDASALSHFVRDEVRAGRCTAESPLRVDLAVLVAPNGRLRHVRPNAIGCPTVEQYASGLVMRMARGNVPPPDQDRWYRFAVTFTWQ